MKHSRFRSRKTIMTAAAVLGLAAAGIGWYIAAQNNRPPAYQAPLPKPATSQTASPTSPAYTISAGRVPDAPFQLPAGYTVHIFADKLGASARDLVYSPGGTLLVSNPAGGNIIALPDKNRDGAADAATVALTAGDNPHGLAFYKNQLYVAFTTSIARYHWNESTLTATLDRELFKLPANRNHNKRTIIFDAKGQMFISVGSTCNVCREPDPKSATILTATADGSNLRIFASGLRNAPFMTFNPTSNELWATEMGRDFLGDNLPPDEIDIVRDNHNYGWPLCYGDRVPDTSFDRSATNACAATAPPIFPVPAHNSPLGLAFINSTQFPADQTGDLLVAYHGSWNRSVPDGYKVVRLKVAGNTITSSTDFMTGFISGRSVQARPVDLIFNDRGDLFVSDDKSGSVYIIQKQL